MPREPPVTSATRPVRFKEAIRFGEVSKVVSFEEAVSINPVSDGASYKVEVRWVAGAPLFFSAYKHASAMNRRKSD